MVAEGVRFFTPRRFELSGAALAALVVIWLLAGSHVDLPTPRGLPVRITGADGRAPWYAIQMLSSAAPEMRELAKAFEEVVRNDVVFDGEFEFLPGIEPVSDGGSSLDTWQRLGADGLLTVRVDTYGDGVRVYAQLFRLATREQAFAGAYSAELEDARKVAHRITDDLLWHQAGRRGVARTRLAFVSDRLGARRGPTGETRRVKEIFVADYDGANAEAATFDGDLAITPNWSPDGRSIAYTSYRRGFQDIFVLLAEPRTIESPTRGRGKNWLPAWSPDGTRIAFASSRDGTESVYVMNADGSDVRRLGTYGGIDTSPSWSPSGREIAFTSNRSGSPQIWVMGADGSNARQLTSERYCDRPAWSPGPVNELAYVSRTSTGFDIKVIDVATGRERQLTFGPGFNESPAWAPNGRHLAFSSSRSGSEQIWTMTRAGLDLRQVTKVGNNTMPAWSRQ